LTDLPRESSRKSLRTRLQCPNCGQEHLERIARQGFLSKEVYPLFGFYPWECAICRKEFLIRKRGGSYRRVPCHASAPKEQIPSPEN
jgi:ribosomal protein L37AE/L43A